MSVRPSFGSSPRNTGSARSTETKSANRGTAKSASSCEVRVTSRVVPISSPASYSSFSRSWATSARPDMVRSSVVSRSVATLPGGPPSRSVDRWLTASSRPCARCTSSVASRPDANSRARSLPMPRARQGRPSASAASPSSRRASSFASASRPSPSRISTPSRTACRTASWCSYIRVISAGPSPCVWRSSRRLTSAVPPVATASTPAAEPSRDRLDSVTPAATSPTTRPSPSSTGTTARTDGPSVPVYVSRTIPPATAGAMVPTKCLPIWSGSGCV